MHILLHTKQSLGSILNIYQQYKKWLIHFDLLNEIILLPIWYAASVKRRQTLLRKERKGKTAGRRWNKTTE